MRRLIVSLFVLAGLFLLPRVVWAKTASIGEPLRLEIEGHPDAYFYKPQAKGARPVVMYLHGRNGNPSEDCRKWAKVASQFGWVVCPSGPGGGDGARSWSAGSAAAEVEITKALESLKKKYKGKVQRNGNVLVGFSEGAFVAMNVGLHDQSTWTKWLILAASDQYWGGEVKEALDPEKRKVRRVFLLTGENDGVVENTKRVGETLKKNHVPVKVKVVPGMGHEIPGDRMVSTYRRPLAWLVAAK